MLIKVPTEKTVSVAADAIQAAIQANHFGVMQVHNLQKTMVKKDVEFPMSVPTALPTFISLYKEWDKTVIASYADTQQRKMMIAAREAFTDSRFDREIRIPLTEHQNIHIHRGSRQTAS
jgi:hypothetical protein